MTKLEHYCFPWQPETAIRDFVQYYNQERYHESLDNMTPADVCFGHKRDVLCERERVKARTMQLKREQYRAAQTA